MSNTYPRLRFSSAYTDLGNFRSFVSHNDTSRELHLGISIATAMRPDNYGMLALSVQDGTEVDGTKDDEENLEIAEGDLEPYQFDADFYFGAGQALFSLQDRTDKKKLELQTTDVEEDSAVEHRGILKKANFCIRSNEGENLISFEIVRRQSNVHDRVSEYFFRAKKDIIDGYLGLTPLEYIDDQDSTFGLLKVSMPGLFPEGFLAKPKTGTVPSEEANQRFWPLPPYMEEAFNDLRVMVNQIAYLGPLRAPAKRYYTQQADSNLQSDVTGELLPLLLRDRMNAPVSSAEPISHKARRLRLVDALNSWLYFMRTGNADAPNYFPREFRIDSMQDVLVELGIKSVGGTETHSLADSGFGYSQLLPILVRGLMLSPHRTLLVEQPELHLNPALQIRLSDFFVAMSSVGKQILIETHSEHIVNAIRAIAAESEELDISKNCTVFYLEAVNGEPTLYQLNVLEDGSVPDWPASFFGEAAQLLGRILRAQKKYR